MSSSSRRNSKRTAFPTAPASPQPSKRARGPTVTHASATSAAASDPVPVPTSSPASAAAAAAGTAVTLLSLRPAAAPGRFATDFRVASAFDRSRQVNADDMVYQWLRTVDAWLGLCAGDKLRPEGFEDFDVLTSGGELSLHQVKHTQTLTISSLHTTFIGYLRNFLACVSPVRLVIHSHLLVAGPTVKSWADQLAGYEEAAVQALCNVESIRVAVDTAADDDGVTRMVQNTSWQLHGDGCTALRSKVVAKLVARLPPGTSTSVADLAVDALVGKVLQCCSKAEAPGCKILDRSFLQQVVDHVRSLPLETAQEQMRQMYAQMATEEHAVTRDAVRKLHEGLEQAVAAVHGHLDHVGSRVDAQAEHHRQTHAGIADIRADLRASAAGGGGGGGSDTSIGNQFNNSGAQGSYHQGNSYHGPVHHAPVIHNTYHSRPRQLSAADVAAQLRRNGPLSTAQQQANYEAGDDFFEQDRPDDIQPDYASLLRDPHLRSIGHQFGETGYGAPIYFAPNTVRASRAQGDFKTLLKMYLHQTNDGNYYCYQGDWGEKFDQKQRDRLTQYRIPATGNVRTAQLRRDAGCF